MKRKKLSFYLSYISNNKLTGKMLTTHDFMFFKKNRYSINIKYLSNLIFFFFFIKSLKLNNNVLSFVILPKTSRYFTLVKGPSGHKRGKYLCKFQQYKFLLFFSKNFNYFLHAVSFPVGNLFFFFNFLQKYFYYFSNNTFIMKKIKLNLTSNVSFI